MTDTKHRPVIRKLITPGPRSGFLETSTSPKSPLEYKVLSPTGIITRDTGGIGLGILAALENVSVNEKKVDLSNVKPMRSDPIPVIRSRNLSDHSCDQDMGYLGSFEEEYTIVTCHKPNKSFTKVYHSGKGIEVREKGCIFNISPARVGDEDMKVCDPSGFLSSCHLCNKRLQGKDIYMYRGEKAFCSPECRSRQIAMDERPEKYCSSQASSNGTSRLIATGIFAI